MHKSQGSEFPAVILPVAQVPPRLCYRNLFYTGVTRARRLCVVAGRRDVVNSMMSNIRQNLRYSGLCALLQAGQPPEQLSTEGKALIKPRRTAAKLVYFLPQLCYTKAVFVFCPPLRALHT